MDSLKMIALGLVQGLTEFLPVSSSGHLVLFDEWLALPSDSLNSTILLHLGTLVALVFFFRGDLARLVRGFVRGEATERRMVGLILAGTLVTALCGFALQTTVVAMFDSLLAVGLGLYLTAGALWGSARWAERHGAGATVRDPTLRDALWIGLGQAVALFPGVSRSGATISMGIVGGLGREQAARFSFLLAIPAILGANLLEILQREPASATASSVGLLPMILGMIVATVSGWWALRILFRILIRTNLGAFSYYCFGVGTLAILWHLFR